jgi:hypothetical protein
VLLIFNQIPSFNPNPLSLFLECVALGFTVELSLMHVMQGLKVLLKVLLDLHMHAAFATGSSSLPTKRCLSEVLKALRLRR